MDIVGLFCITQESKNSLVNTVIGTFLYSPESDACLLNPWEAAV